MASRASDPSDVQALLDEINAAGSAVLHPAGDHAEGPARKRLVAAAQKLIHGVQNPLEVMVEASFQVRHSGPETGYLNQNLSAEMRELTRKSIRTEPPQRGNPGLRRPWGLRART